MYAEFDLVMPSSLNELFGVLDKVKEAPPMLLAGGTVALVDIRSGKERPDLVISLDRIPELLGIDRDGEAVAIGARCTVTDILTSDVIARVAPSLVAASRIFAGQMVRNAATIGGNIACGSPAADLVPSLLSLDAEVELASRDGRRRLKLADYYLGYKKNVRRPDELIVRVLLPALPANAYNAFYKLARRKGDAITVTGTAVTVVLQGNRCAMARIALGSVAPVPMRARKAEGLLEGKAFTLPLVEEAAELAMQECAPIDDVRATAAYRRKMVKVLTRRLLTGALEQLQ
jgi:CO/xanthine dehydrogenase FAD-binding subunit